ncbi:MAG: phosphoribosylanthranilate isomerase [Pseudomonadota bacterium]
MRPRVKICCMASPEEAEMAAKAGADLVGLVGPMPSGAGIVTPDMCRRISDATPAWTTPVLLTSSETSEAIVHDVTAANVRAVQIVRHVDASVHADLARELPHVRRFQVIHVEDGSALDLIGTYGGVADAFLLDSGRPSAAELGGTGRVHDWQISAEFVRRSPLPVFLAGGLKPENVAEAIGTVRPFGLDICSGVRTPDDRLDPDSLRAFMDAVNAVA